MQASSSNGSSHLTPRQALICAAVTGWEGDAPSSWHWPMAPADLADWGRSYLPELSGSEAESHFQLLVEHGLFMRTCYPTFKRSYFACSYDSAFLRELPEGWTFPGWQKGERQAIQDVSAFWNELRGEATAQYGDAFIWWGICAGQGSQSGSSGWGPCLGPSCCWYTDGKHAKCHHDLEFLRMPEVVLPDMRVLIDLCWAKATDNEKRRAMDVAIVALRKIDPSLPCRTSDEGGAARKHEPT